MRAIRSISRKTPQVSGPRLSKAYFRWQRDWSARVQRFIHIYLPLIGLGLLGWHVAEDNRIHSVIEVEIDRVVRAIMTDTDLAVRGVEILGASTDLEVLLAETTYPLIGMPSIELGVKDLRQSIEGLDEVRKARVTLSPTGMLRISIEGRHPAALFRNHAGRLSVIDREGVEIRPVRERRSEPDLILLLGEGATDHVNQALAIMSMAQGLRDRFRAMVRVGERRWNVILDRDMRILLPAEEPVAAMARVMELHRGESELLDRDLTAVDMRVPERPTLRMPLRVMETRRREDSAKNVEGEDT